MNENKINVYLNVHIIIYWYLIHGRL